MNTMGSGIKMMLATVPNRSWRCEAALLRNCHLICPGATWKLLGPSTPIPTSALQKVWHAAIKVCSSLSLLVWKMMLQQFQAGLHVVKPRHGQIGIWFALLIVTKMSLAVFCVHGSISRSSTTEGGVLFYVLRRMLSLLHIPESWLW